MPLDAASLSAESFSHVRTIIGMVLGLSLARLVNGLTRLIQHPGKTRIYAIHLGWVLFLFITIIHFWWYEFHLNVVERWTFPLYAFLIVYTMGYAALAALLFPDDMSDYSDYEHYFEARKRWFYGLLALTFLFDFGDTLIKGEAYLASLGPEYLVRQAAFVSLSLLAALWRNQLYQALFVAFAVLYQVSWILRAYDLLG